MVYVMYNDLLTTRTVTMTRGHQLRLKEKRVSPSAKKGFFNIKVVRLELPDPGCCDGRFVWMQIILRYVN